MRFIALFCVMFCAAGALAQDNSARLNSLLSRDFAQQALSHWQTGDRSSAIIAALRGIPAEASEDDGTTYAMAFDALRLAMVSRSVRLPLEKPSVAGFSPRGDRVVTAAAFPEGATTDADSVRLWDPQSGTMIAELLPHDRVFGFSLGTVMVDFSPDSRLLAVGLPKSGQVHIFDAATGAPVTVLGRAMDNGLGSYPFARFTADGAALIVNSYLPQEISVYRTGDWSKIAERALGDCHFMYPIGRADSGNAAYFAMNNLNRTNRFNSRCPATEVSTTVHRFGSDGSEDIVFTASADFMPGAGTVGSVSPDGRRALLPTADFGTMVVDLESGTAVAQVGSHIMQSYAVQFAQTGPYLVDTEKFLSDVELAGRTFDGSAHDASIEDVLPYAHMVHSSEGVWMGILAQESGQRGYVGGDIPIGRELHDFVWEQLPEAVREMVNADRVGG